VNSREYYEGYWSPASINLELATFPELQTLLAAHISRTARCLDLGCGDGATCGVFLKANTAEYVGVDISEAAVERARARGLDARRIDDATRLPFPDHSFDAVVSVEVLEHLFLPQPVAREVLRVLKPGGTFFVTVPNVAYWRRRLELAAGRWNPAGDGLSIPQPWRDPHIRFFTRSRLRDMLLGAGFARVEVGGHWGTFLRDTPVVARFFIGSPRRSSPIYQAVQRALPSFFGMRLHAVAVAP
jgi:methionine biosynthesis protein MetW